MTAHPRSVLVNLTRPQTATVATVEAGVQKGSDVVVLQVGTQEPVVLTAVEAEEFGRALWRLARTLQAECDLRMRADLLWEEQD